MDVERSRAFPSTRHTTEHSDILDKQNKARELQTSSGSYAGAGAAALASGVLAASLAPPDMRDDTQPNREDMKKPDGLGNKGESVRFRISMLSGFRTAVRRNRFMLWQATGHDTITLC